MWRDPRGHEQGRAPAASYEAAPKIVSGIVPEKLSMSCSWADRAPKPETLNPKP